MSTRSVCWSGLVVFCIFTVVGVRADPIISDANWISMGGSPPVLLRPEASDTDAAIPDRFYRAVTP